MVKCRTANIPRSFERRRGATPSVRNNILEIHTEPTRGSPRGGRAPCVSRGYYFGQNLSASTHLPPLRRLKLHGLLAVRHSSIFTIFPPGEEAPKLVHCQLVLPASLPVKGPPCPSPHPRMLKTQHFQKKHPFFLIKIAKKWR